MSDLNKSEVRALGCLIPKERVRVCRKSERELFSVTSSHSFPIVINV